jgi:hypothetical protein
MTLNVFAGHLGRARVVICFANVFSPVTTDLWGQYDTSFVLEVSVVAVARVSSCVG